MLLKDVASYCKGTRCEYQIVDNTLYLISPHIGLIRTNTTTLPSAFRGIAKEIAAPDTSLKDRLSALLGESKDTVFNTGVALHRKSGESCIRVLRGVETETLDPYPIFVSDAYLSLVEQDSLCMLGKSATDSIVLLIPDGFFFIMPVALNDNKLESAASQFSDAASLLKYSAKSASPAYSLIEKIHAYADLKQMKEEKAQKDASERIAELTQQIKALESRISELLAVANACKESGIELDRYRKSGYNSHYNTYQHGSFMADCINHRLGFGYGKAGNQIKELRIYGGGSYGRWDFHTNGKTVYETDCDDPSDIRKPSLRSLERFLEGFDNFEKQFYTYVNKIISGNEGQENV